MPVIVEDQIFPSLLDFKAALQTWAIEKNFTPHILDSDKQRVRAGCRTALNCPFRIRVNYSAKEKVARVTTCEDEHSHPVGDNVSQTIKRPETAKLKFLISAVPPLLKVNINTTTRQIVAAIEQKYGQQISCRQAQKVKRVLCKKPCRHCHQFGHSAKYCPQRPTSTEADDGDGENEAADDSSTGSERPRKKSRCLQCFQTGHNRKNCPEKPTQPSSSNMLQAQLQQAAYAPAQPPSTENNPVLEPMDEGLTLADSAPPVEGDRAISQPTTTQMPGPSAQINFRPSVYNSMVPATSLAGSSFAAFADDVVTVVPSRSAQEAADTQSKPPENPMIQHVRPPPDPRMAHPRPQPPPQDPKLKAAELMRQAASLTQEAARLNYEAARLIATAPG